MKKFVFLSITFLSAFLILYCSNINEESNNGMNVYRQIKESDIPWITWAKSVEDRDIYLLELGNGDSTTLIFGGFHGSEIKGVQLVHRFAEYLYNEYKDSLKSRVIIVPVVNPDGLVKAKRQNVNAVDINRNFPTENWSKEYKSRKNFPGYSPASEPETKAVMVLLEKYRPQRIISVHTPLNMVNYDGPALDLANKMAQFNKYPVQANIGYPTPGSFGTYAGIERKIPTITLELPRHSFKKIWEKNREALLTTLNF